MLSPPPPSRVAILLLPIVDPQPSLTSLSRRLPPWIPSFDIAASTIEELLRSFQILATSARFTIEEHNKKENAMVQFVKVVNAKEQVVAGMMYYITIEATDGGVKKLYEAKVWLMEWINFKEVQEFKLVRDPPGEAEVWMREWMNFKEEWLNLKEVTEFKPVGDTAPGEASA